MRHIPALAILVCAPLLAAEPNAAQSPPTCAHIDKAISANEDFAELALANDRAAAKDALARIHRTFDRLKPSLPAAAVTSAETQIEAAGTAFAAGDMPSAAVAAIEVYRVLITALKSRLPATLEVAMLDYTGFRFHALIALTPPDWNAIAETVAMSADNTAKSQKRLGNNRGLSDLIGNTQKGLAGAAAAKHLNWLGSAAQIQLDAVDLLEQVIKNPSPDACS